MTKFIDAKPLTAEVFAPFGDVIDCRTGPDMIINQGNCERYHNLAKLDFDSGDAGLSLFNAKARTLPYRLSLLERHPKGSQAFIPMTPAPFLVIVAEGQAQEPQNIHGFITEPYQGVNFHKNIWHGVLTPLQEPGIFAVIDRIGPGDNLEEFHLAEPVTINAVT